MRNKEMLTQMQSLDLDMKITLTKSRIREWVNNYGLDNVYISFSGGKDSTVLLDIARQEYPTIKAVFCDTGLEYPELKQFVKTFDNIEIIRPLHSFKYIIEKYGYPIVTKEYARKIEYQRKGSEWTKKYFDLQNRNKYTVPEKWHKLLDAPFKVSSECCTFMKKYPFHKYDKENNAHGMTGSLAEESRLRQQKWIQNGCNAFYLKHPISNPLSFWKEEDILKYIYINELPICSVYGDVIIKDGHYTTTGAYRTGCIYCGFGVHLEEHPNRFERLKEDNPQLHKYVMEELGFKDVLDYINVKGE